MINTCYYCKGIEDKRYQSTLLTPWKFPNDSKFNYACSACYEKWVGKSNQIMPIKTKPKRKTSFQRSNLPAVVKTTKKKTKSPRVKHSTPDYYNCLMNYAQHNWYHPVTGEKKKITSCCKDCKASAPALSQKRGVEITKLITAYKQVGDSLAKLLKPVN